MRKQFYCFIIFNNHTILFAAPVTLPFSIRNGDYMYLFCDQGAINILSAAYGACPSNDVTATMQNYANGRASFSIRVSDNFFPGICASTSASLVGRYTCVPLSSGNTNSYIYMFFICPYLKSIATGASYMADASDRNLAILTCPVGTVINVDSATYGSMADTSCSQIVGPTFINPLVDGVTNAYFYVTSGMTGTTYCSATNNYNRLSVAYKCQTSGIHKHNNLLFYYYY